MGKLSYETIDQALEVAKICIWEIDHPTKKLSWNCNMYSQLHLDNKTEEITSLAQWKKLVHPKDQDNFDLYFENGINLKKPFDMTTCFQLPNKQIKYFRIIGSFEDSKNGPKLIGTMWDNTISKENENRIRRVMNGTTDSVYVLNPVYNEENKIMDFKICAVNKHACQEMELEEKDILALGFKQALSENRINGTFKRYKKVFETGIPSADEYTMNKDSIISNIYFNYATKVENDLLIFNRDITEQKEKQSENYKLSLIAELTSNGVMLTDAKGVIKWVNNGFTQMTGYCLLEILGQKPENILYGPGTSEFMQRKMKQAMDLEEEYNVEIINYNKKNEEYTVRIESKPIYDHNDVFDGYMSIHTNVTKERTLQQKLIEQEKMATIGMLSASIGHEINNPLTILKGNIDLLKEYIEQVGDENCKSIVNKISPALTRIENIVKGFRTHSRQPYKKDDIFSIHKALQSAVDFLNSILVSNKINIEIKLESSLDKVNGGIDSFEQIFLNLLSNSIYELKRLNQSRSIWIKTYQKNDKIVIDYQDNGPGIPAEVKPKIFTTFFTSKPKGEGTGLGMSISKQILNEMNGSIKLLEKKESGVYFQIVLPLVSEGTNQNKHNTNIKTNQSKKTTKNKKVLIVEDEPFIAELLGDILESLNYDTTVELKSKNALKLVKDKDFDIVVTDYQMPDVNGVELINSISMSNLKKKPQFILISGDIVDLKLDDNILFLPKPFSVSDVHKFFKNIS